MAQVLAFYVAAVARASVLPLAVAVSQIPQPLLINPAAPFPLPSDG